MLFIQKSKTAAVDSSFNDPLIQDATTTTVLGRGQSIAVLSAEVKKYTHTLLGFSFTYPSSFSISSFGSSDDDVGETILLQADGGKRGLQILITPFDEDVTLTEERIHHDILDIVMSDVSTRTVGVGEKSVQAIMFTSANSSMGKSREAWFVREKRLYQISAPESAESVFMEALDSLRF